MEIRIRAPVAVIAAVEEVHARRYIHRFDRAEHFPCFLADGPCIFDRLPQVFGRLRVARDAFEVLGDVLHTLARVLEVRERRADILGRLRVAEHAVHVRHHVLDVHHRAVHGFRDRHEVRRHGLDVAAVFGRHTLKLRHEA